MKNYEVQIDVIMTGTVSIEANSKKEAKEKAKQKCFVASDLRWFSHIGTDVVEIEEN